MLSTVSRRERRGRFGVRPTLVGACLALVLAATTVFVAAPAAAAAIEPPLSITSPGDGASVDSRTPAFTGTGIPGDTVTLTYGDSASVAGKITVDGNGDWTLPTADLSAADPLEAGLSVRATANGPDGTARPGTAEISVLLPVTERAEGETAPPIQSDEAVQSDAAEPPVDEKQFRVTSPTDNSTVDSPTPAFTGTGHTGDAIEIFYDSNRGGAFTGNATVDANGDWTIPKTDFSNGDVGQTTFELSVRAFKADGSFREQIAMTINFSAPPVTSVDLVITDPASVVLTDDDHVYARGTGWPGTTVVVEYINGSGALVKATPRYGSGPGVNTQGTWGPLLYYFDDLAADQKVVKTFWQQQDAGGAMVANRIELDLNNQSPPGQVDVPPGGAPDPGASMPGTGNDGTSRTLAATGSDTTAALLLTILLMVAGAATFFGRRVRVSTRH